MRLIKRNRKNNLEILRVMKREENLKKKRNKFKMKNKRRKN